MSFTVIDGLKEVIAHHTAARDTATDDETRRFHEQMIVNVEEAAELLKEIKATATAALNKIATSI
ncbi:hypothetical protein CDG24_25245 [Salmonella enterica subsp. enterica serovar Newport]|nr:hypothetical protein [Salmonella enterica subsp. enterica serovar Newport]